MIVIADTSPLHYFILLEHPEILQKLYGRVIIPEAVALELKARFDLLPKLMEFNHQEPAEWLFQDGDEGTQFPGFNDVLGRMEKLIADLNVLMS